jgi:hypothetical protein
MAGRYWGYHPFTNKTGSFEVFWKADGWWWWPRAKGCRPAYGKAVGPFLTSTEAHRNATNQRMANWLLMDARNYLSERTKHISDRTKLCVLLTAVTAISFWFFVH